MTDDHYHVEKVTVHKGLIKDRNYELKPKPHYEHYFVVRHNGSLLGRMKTATGNGRIKTVGNDKWAEHLDTSLDVKRFLKECKSQLKM